MSKNNIRQRKSEDLSRILTIDFQRDNNKSFDVSDIEVLRIINENGEIRYPFEGRFAFPVNGDEESRIVEGDEVSYKLVKDDDNLIVTTLPEPGYRFVLESFFNGQEVENKMGLYLFDQEEREFNLRLESAINAGDIYPVAHNDGRFILLSKEDSQLNSGIYAKLYNERSINLAEHLIEPDN